MRVPSKMTILLVKSTDDRVSIYWCLNPLSKIKCLSIPLLPGQKLSTQVLLICLWIYCSIKLEYSSQFCLANSYSIFKHNSDIISSKKCSLYLFSECPEHYWINGTEPEGLISFFVSTTYLESHLRSGITSYPIIYLKKPAWE